MKVFISQPMKDKTEKEILDQRKQITDYIQGKYKNAKIIDSYVQTAPDEAYPIFFLGLSMQFLSQADLCIFAEGWEDARGCRIEHQVCEEYNIPRLLPEMMIDLEKKEENEVAQQTLKSAT